VSCPLEGVPQNRHLPRRALTYLGNAPPTPRGLSYTFETDLLEHAQQCLSPNSGCNPILIRHPYIGMKFLHDPTT